MVTERSASGCARRATRPNADIDARKNAEAVVALSSARAR
jgi:hypothetical protein